MFKKYPVKKLTVFLFFFSLILGNPSFSEANDLYKRIVPHKVTEPETTPFAPVSRKQFNILDNSKERWRLDLEQGDMKFNISRTAPGTFVQAHYTPSEKYFLLGKFDYLNRFGNRTYNYTAGGGYYIHPKVILTDLFSYAPIEYGFPKIQNAFEITALLPHSLQLYVRYTYRLYNVANAHALTPGINWRFARWGVLDLNYDPTITKVENKLERVIDYGIPIRLSFIPIKDVFKFSLLYSRTKESFDKDTHAKTRKFEANHFGGGVEWILANNIGLRVDMDYEKRDNGLTVQTYTSSIFHQF